MFSFPIAVILLIVGALIYHFNDSAFPIELIMCSFLLIGGLILFGILLDKAEHSYTDERSRRSRYY